MKKKTLLLAVACMLILTACGINTEIILDEGGTTDTTQDLATSMGTEAEPETETLNPNAAYSDSNGTLIVTEVPTGGNIATEPSTETFYLAATSLSATEVESYAADIKDMVLNADWESFVNEISYPIIVDGLTMENAADLRDYIADSEIDANFLAAIEAETCVEMFNNYQGITMGAEGQLWLGAVQNEAGEFELKVIEINSMFVQ